jgi:hypothetical protein
MTLKLPAWATILPREECPSPQWITAAKLDAFTEGFV